MFVQQVLAYFQPIECIAVDAESVVRITKTSPKSEISKWLINCSINPEFVGTILLVLDKGTC